MAVPKVLVITGASSGMGKAAATDLIQQGHTVFCAARSLGKMKDLQEMGGILIELDVSDEKSCEQAVQKILKQTDRVDVLWNNAGFGLYGPVEEVPLDKARYQFEVNLFGLAKMTQLVLPTMRQQNSGVIINTSSMGGKMYTPLGAWYHATKHAVEGFSDCLRLELKEFNIQVVVLEPGIIDTAFYDVLRQNLSDSWLKGPYQKIISQLLEAQEQNPIQGSSPQVISETIQKIVSVEKPKTRYVAGKLAKPLIMIRTLLGDRIFDRVIMRQFG